VIFVVVLKSKILPTDLLGDSSDSGREVLFSEENWCSEGDGVVGIPNVSNTFMGSTFHTLLGDGGEEEIITEGELLVTSEGDETCVLGSVSSKTVPELFLREGWTGGDSEGTRNTA
jgi:hypothetical protein